MPFLLRKNRITNSSMVSSSLVPLLRPSPLEWTEDLILTLFYIPYFTFDYDIASPRIGYGQEDPPILRRWSRGTDAVCGRHRHQWTRGGPHHDLWAIALPLPRRIARRPFPRSGLQEQERQQQQPQLRRSTNPQPWTRHSHWPRHDEPADGDPTLWLQAHPLLPRVLLCWVCDQGAELPNVQQDPVSEQQCSSDAHVRVDPTIDLFIWTRHLTLSYLLLLLFIVFFCIETCFFFQVLSWFVCVRCANLANLLVSFHSFIYVRLCSSLLDRAWSIFVFVLPTLAFGGTKTSFTKQETMAQTRKRVPEHADEELDLSRKNRIPPQPSGCFGEWHKGQLAMDGLIFSTFALEKNKKKEDKHRLDLRFKRAPLFSLVVFVFRII